MVDQERTARLPGGDYVRNVCRVGQGMTACRYLVGVAGGFRCGKHQPEIFWQIAARQAAGTMRAQGDNCDGFEFDKVLE